MKNRTIRALGLLSLLFFTRCAVRPPTLPLWRLGPEIRVGIIWGKDSIMFSTKNNFAIVSHERTFIAKGLKKGRWQVQIKTSIPAKFIYRLVAGSFKSKIKAWDRAKELKNEGFETEILPVGRITRIGGKIINNNRLYRVYLGNAFEREEEAQWFRDSIWNRIETFIVREIAQNAKGTILVKNCENGQYFESSKSILIQGSSVTLYDVPVGIGYHWEREEIRTYPEIIAFALDSYGKLAAINILPLEQYLRGVVPSEMSHGFPLEALKAQAVAARGELLSKLGIVHRNEPFDVCADVHCQAYSGLTNYTSSTDRAVKKTRGLVLWKEDSICEALYSAVCGGHGEDIDKAWGMAPKSYLKGRFDGPEWLKRYGDLTNEENARQWIYNSPRAHCNTTRGTTIPALDYTKKYFRWIINIPQEELAHEIAAFTGKNVGLILDLIPLKRGVSGRITHLKIVGQKGETIITGELNIRKAMIKNTLWSSCFYVIKKGWQNGCPEEFVIRGAGWGHGIGMCQTGAATLALEGKSFDQILKFYYKDIKIRKLY